jgi:hypothetical protein
VTGSDKRTCYHGPNIKKGDTNKDTVIKNFMEQMKVGRKQPRKNLALYLLRSTYSVGLGYLLLADALSNKSNDHKAAFEIKYTY